MLVVTDADINVRTLLDVVKLSEPARLGSVPKRQSMGRSPAPHCGVISVCLVQVERKDATWFHVKHPPPRRMFNWAMRCHRSVYTYVV